MSDSEAFPSAMTRTIPSTVSGDSSWYDVAACGRRMEGMGLLPRFSRIQDKRHMQSHAILYDGIVFHFAPKVRYLDSGDAAEGSGDPLESYLYRVFETPG
jgi:hypothetical protein